MVCIKDFEMPRCCDACSFMKEDYYSRDYCAIDGLDLRWSDSAFSRHKDCPLIEIDDELIITPPKSEIELPF